MKRQDGRKENQLRKITITRDYIKFAEGSCLIELDSTRVVCTASLEEKVPPFLKNTGTGWVTAEYGMIPRSCKTRLVREARAGRANGRTYEIQRLIGRSLRSVIDMAKLGERTIWIDCDVLQADGGTRTASITGSFIALADALCKLKRDEVISELPILDYVAAVSVGILDGEPVLDLTFEEDSKVDVDMNVVMTGSGKFVEVQGTAEHGPFSKAQLDNMLHLAKEGIETIIALQKKLLEI